MDVLDVLPKTEDTRIFLIAKVTCLSELLVVWQVRSRMNDQMTRLFERFTTVAHKNFSVCATCVTGFHVIAVMRLCLVVFVAHRADEIFGIFNVMLIVVEKRFCGADQSSTTA